MEHFVIHFIFRCCLYFWQLWEVTNEWTLSTRVTKFITFKYYTSMLCLLSCFCQILFWYTHFDKYHVLWTIFFCTRYKAEPRTYIPMSLSFVCWKNSCLKLHFSPLRLVLKESIWCPPSPSFNMSLHQSGDFFFILKMVRVLGEQYLDLWILMYAKVQNKVLYVPLYIYKIVFCAFILTCSWKCYKYKMIIYDVIFMTIQTNAMIGFTLLITHLLTLWRAEPVLWS